MRQSTHRILREGTARQPVPSKLGGQIASAPTEPLAFLSWSAEHGREEGKFELSRGRVICDMAGGPAVTLAMADIFDRIPDAPAAG